MHAARGRVDTLRQGRVDVHRVRDVVGRRAEFDRQHEFVDDFRTLFADDVGPKQFVCLSVRNQFEEAFWFSAGRSRRR